MQLLSTIGLSVIVAGIGTFGFGMWLYVNYVNFRCDDTGADDTSVTACFAPDNGIAEIVVGILIGTIGGILATGRKSRRNVTEQPNNNK